jgi:hypothetical protein
MVTFLLIVLLLWAVGLLLWASSAVVGFLRTGVPVVRTNVVELSGVLEGLGVSEKDVVYDLGSGDGIAALHVAKHTGAHVIGYELTLWAFVYSKVRGIIQRSPATFKYQDFFSVSWEPATVIHAYLYPKIMGRVEEKFLAEGRPGSVLVVRDFPLPKLVPHETLQFGVPVDAVVDSRGAAARGKLLWKSLRGTLPISHEVYVYRK